MTFLKNHLNLLPLLTVIGSQLLLGAVPAQAASISSGPAVAHIDSAKAKVTMETSRTYKIAMPKGSKGQWMGERTNSKGETIIRVGSLTAEQLGVAWKRFLYPSSGARASLIWETCCDKRKFAVVHLVGKPKRVGNEEIFEVTSGANLDLSMSNVSIHIDRTSVNSRGGQVEVSNDLLISTFPSTQSIDVVVGLFISQSLQNANSIEMRIYNNDGNSTCWSQTDSNVTISTDSYTSVPSKTCANVQYKNEYGGYGASIGAGTTATLNGDVNYGTSAFSLILTPPQNSSYTYSYVFDPWIID